MTTPLAYSHRPRPFGHEVAYRLEPGGLFVDSGRRQETIPYRDIASIRLAYQPTNVGAAGFRARLRLAGRRTLTLSNLSWKSWVDVERRDAAYRSFMLALLREVSRANPALACRAGQPALQWAGVAATAALTVAGLAWAISAAARRGAWAIALIAAMILATFAWQAWEMVRRNRPAAFRPDAPPAEVLPSS